MKSKLIIFTQTCYYKLFFKFLCYKHNKKDEYTLLLSLCSYDYRRVIEMICASDNN